MTDRSGDGFNEACSPSSLCAENESGEVEVKRLFPAVLSVQQGGSSLDQRTISSPKSSPELASYVLLLLLSPGHQLAPVTRWAINPLTFHSASIMHTTFHYFQHLPILHSCSLHFSAIAKCGHNLFPFLTEGRVPGTVLPC